jgi:hypothetical protein
VNSLETSAVKVTSILGILDEGGVLDEFFKLGGRHEEVLLAMFFSGSRRARGICGSISDKFINREWAERTRDAKAKLVRKFSKETLKKSALSDA